MTLTPMDLTGQFILCKAPDTVPDGWHVRQNGDWYLGSHPTLPVIDILTTDHTVIGWLLGWPINSEGEFVTQHCSIDIESGNGSVALQVESALYEYGGRWAAVFVAAGLQRVYLDACGSLAAVFSPRHEIVASTPTLVPYSEGCEDDHQLIATIMIPGHDNWYPFGLTPRRHVERLLPNHFVDLGRWETVRHWPKQEIEERGDTERAVQEFGTIVARSIAAIARDHRFYLPLTGGHDSRVLLACARDVLSRCTLFTVRMPTSAAKLDCHLVQNMSRRLRLDHEFVPFRRLTSSSLTEFRYRTGHAIDGVAVNYAKVFQQLDASYPMLWGAAGELGRGYHWRRGDTESSKLTGSDLIGHLARLLHPVCYAPLEDRAQRWIDALPVRNTLSAWGLLYNEQYNGCWIGPKEYGYTHNCYRVWPMCHRHAIEIMLSLPTEYRLKAAFTHDVIADRWPELLAFPLNWPMGIRRYLSFLRRRVSAFKGRCASWSRHNPEAANRTLF